MMRRRHFITALTGAMASSTVWPSADAQQAERPSRVGVLFLVPQSQLASILLALRDGLKSLGWTEDRNLQLYVRNHPTDAKVIEAYADELVRLAPEVIVTSSYLATRAVQQRTRTIPIVFVAVGDPIENGLVKSLTRPEGNSTGVTNLYSSIGGKWASVLKDFVPSVARVGIVIIRSARPGYVSAIEAEAAALRLQAIRIPYGTAAELERAVDAFAAEPNGSLIVHPPSLAGIDHEWFFWLTEKHRLPTIYQDRRFVHEGGLMSYGTSFDDYIRQAVAYVDRVLRGGKPGDLPVQFPTRFKLSLNLKAAKAIGLEISSELFLRADEVIE
jgi:putative tryptophan/tyrosine transport system substrate-binding protein